MFNNDYAQITVNEWSAGNITGGNNILYDIFSLGNP